MSPEEIEELIAELKKRLQKNLKNAATIDDETLNSAAVETAELVGQRIAPMYAKLDVAVYRYKMNTKIGATEMEEKLYESAIKVIRSIPLLAPDPLDPLAPTQGAIAIGQRTNEWV